MLSNAVRPLIQIETHHYLKSGMYWSWWNRVVYPVKFSNKFPILYVHSSIVVSSFNLPTFALHIATHMYSQNAFISFHAHESIMTTTSSHHRRHHHPCTQTHALFCLNRSSLFKFNDHIKIATRKSFYITLFLFSLHCDAPPQTSTKCEMRANVKKELMVDCLRIRAGRKALGVTVLVGAPRFCSKNAHTHRKPVITFARRGYWPVSQIAVAYTLLWCALERSR